VDQPHVGLRPRIDGERVVQHHGGHLLDPVGGEHAIGLPGIEGRLRIEERHPSRPGAGREDLDLVHAWSDREIRGDLAELARGRLALPIDVNIDRRAFGAA